MKASSSASATMAAIMAFSTKGAGPNLHSFSKMDAIAESKTGVRSALRAFLIGGVAGHVVSWRHLHSQATAIGLRCEAADLVDLREILGAGGKEHVSGNSRFVS